MAAIERLASFILKWEGGYVNDPLDRGGETNRGVTIAAWRASGHDTTEKISIVKQGNRTFRNVTRSLWEMTDGQWMDIFRRGYWDRWQADAIASQPLAGIVVDWVWGSGVHGIKIPQRMLGVRADGIVGADTLAALNAVDARNFFTRVAARREEFFNDIVRRDPSQGRFLGGWLARLNDLKQNTWENH